jgi:hypothetical protein
LVSLVIGHWSVSSSRCCQDRHTTNDSRLPGPRRPCPPYIATSAVSVTIMLDVLCLSLTVVVRGGDILNDGGMMHERIESNE